MSTIINVPELSERLKHGDIVLLDVRLPEDFVAGHIPGAVNQCVFEVVFLSALQEKGFSKDQPICVYGAAADSGESSVAAEKLKRAGFSQVLVFTAVWTLGLLRNVPWTNRNRRRPRRTSRMAPISSTFPRAK
jgi:rhodanese-related sulfurtransferase